MRKEAAVARKENHFKRLQDLNLMDDFLFQTMTTRKETGEEFCRILLKAILRREIGNIRIASQKVVPGIETDRHGIRLDLYIEERMEEVEKSCENGKHEGGVAEQERDGKDGKREGVENNKKQRQGMCGGSANETETPEIYDIEVNQYVLENETLAKRMRFYQSLIDVSLLSSGSSYKKLPSVMVILILPYDPFGAKRMIYTIQNHIKEEPMRQYEDGAVKLVLNTSGTADAIDQKLGELLRYMQLTTEDNVTNPEIKCLHELVQKIKSDQEVSREYMRAWEREWMIREESKEEERKEINRRIVLEMRKAGEPLEKIVRYTQLSEEEIMEL